MSKSKVMELAIKIAGKVDKSLGTSVKTSSKQLNTIIQAANKVSDVTTVGLATMGTGAMAAAKYLTDLGGEWQKATNQVASSTGAAGAQLEKLRGVMETVYANNFGADVNDVAEAVALVDKNMASLSQNGMVQATQGAIALRDAFGYDVAESTRAAEAIRKNFGVSAEKAFDLIAAGAQNGLDFSGELIDTINEYSVQFAKLGLSADDMFQILQSGADGTAWNLDKVGDAVKEFSIRAIDGSDTTISAFQALGYDSDQMMATFAAGGEKANQAFFEVLDQLLSMDDQVQRDAVGVKLFGTMWEDLGAGALQAMADASSAAYSTGEALEQINQVQYNDLDSALEGVRRHLEVAMLPAADAVYQSLMEHMPEVTGALDEMSPVIQEIAGDFGDMAVGAFTEALPQLVTGLRDFAEWLPTAYENAKPFLSFLWENRETVAAFAVGLRALGPAVNTVTKVVAAFNGLKQFATGVKTFAALAGAAGWVTKIAGAFKLLGGALMGPLGIVLAIGTALVLLYKNWDTVKVWMQDFGAAVGQVWSSVAGWVSSTVSSIVQWFQSMGDTLANIWQRVVESFANIFGQLGNLVKAPINAVISTINKAIEGINGLAVDIPDWVPVVGGKQLGFSIPTIPQLAAGGIATRPTLAQIGEGGEPEAVMPLSKLADLLDQWPKPGPNGRGGGAAGGENITFAPVFNFYGSTPTREEAQEAGRISFAEFKRLYKQMRAEERRKNFRTEPV